MLPPDALGDRRHTLLEAAALRHRLRELRVLPAEVRQGLAHARRHCVLLLPAHRLGELIQCLIQKLVHTLAFLPRLVLQ